MYILILRTNGDPPVYYTGMLNALLAETSTDLKLARKFATLEEIVDEQFRYLRALKLFEITFLKE